MARKMQPKYPNTSWGREARGEDIETRVESELRHKRARVQRLAYDDAILRIKNGESPECIISSIAPPKLWGSSDFPDSFEREVNNRVEKAVYDARLSGVHSAIQSSTTPPPNQGGG
ncbi:hypothetical protein GCM10023156_30410 [Novipirellula rosea]|uniref:Uncharacterized protein n=1 Tax=Novipirellula rosea TaxID=1031540 RepID=A0ABP8MWU6_9BACT